MKKRQARKMLVTRIAEVIEDAFNDWADSQLPQEDARLRITGWVSPRLYRMAAKAAVSVFEAGLEGERLSAEEGDP